jgi:tripeptidyl-peptidase-1
VAIANVIGPNNASDCVPEPNNCGEANLDVEWILAVAQNAQTTFWSIANSDPYPFLDWAIAVGNTPNPPLVHSISYGDIEAEGSPVTVMQRFNTEVQKLGVRGVSVIVASGDDGVANFIARGNASACGFNPSYPATAPYVTAVGATQGIESNTTEIACTSTTGGGITTGGGFSTVFPQPSYQTAAVAAYMQNGPNMPPSNMYNGQGRGYPDVAMAGHNFIMTIGGQFTAADGTSASAPVFAGVITLINSARLSMGKPSLGFLNQILYSLQASTPSAFHDIVSGTNNCAAGQQGQQTCCQYGFTATTGWDPLTGLGSVNYPVFSQALINM